MNLIKVKERESIDSILILAHELITCTLRTINLKDSTRSHTDYYGFVTQVPDP